MSDVVEHKGTGPDELSTATGLFRAGRLREADRVCRRILAAEPQHARALHLLALIAQQAGHGAEALALLRRAAGHEPDNPELLHAAGEALMGLGRIDEALAAYERARALAPDMAIIAFSLGHAWLRKGEFAKAEHACRSALELKPDFAQAHNSLGNALRSLGRREEAAAAWRRAIALDPGSPAAYNNLGNVLRELDRCDEAETCYRRAIALDPRLTQSRLNLANLLVETNRLDDAQAELAPCPPEPNVDRVLAHIASRRRALADGGTTPPEQRPADVLERRPANAADRAALFEQANAEQAAGRLADAHATCRELLAIDDRHAGAWQLLGVLALRSGDAPTAVSHIARAAVLAPRRADCQHNLGFALRASGRPAEAEAAFRQAASVDPDFVEAHFQLGNLLRDGRRFAEAQESYRRVLALRPDHHQAANNLAVALGELRALDEAAEYFRRAIELKPDYVEALANLGHTLRATGRAEEAEAACRRAIALAPGFATAHLNLGLALQDLGRFDEALACFRRAHECDPGDSKPAACEGMLHLLRGKFAAGWEKYEARWHVGDLPPRNFAQPQWRGAPLDGKSILLHAEQGFGDTIQFLRYVPLVAARGGTIILEIQKPLLPVAPRIPGIIVVARGETLPAFDLHCPLLSLPLAFGTTLDSIPDAAPYLAPSPERASHWRERIGGGAALKVGIAWAGSAVHRNDTNRSVAVERLAPLLELAGVRWFSLQVAPREAIKHSQIVDLAPELADFGETAAAISALDLVIAADTAVAHLAGALGKPVWVMLPFSPDWRWLLGRADTPWYRSMRLFRQERPGNWDGVVYSVRDALARRLADTARLGTDPAARAEYATLIRVANEHHQAKRHAECEAVLRKALAIDPGNASAWHVLALTRHELDDKAEAIGLMQKAVALEPAAAMFLSDLGIMLHGAGRFAEALDASSRALALNPDQAATHNSVGATLAALDRHEEAIAAYRRALALNPNYFECWTNLAQTQQGLLRLDDAADSFRRALAIRHDYPPAQCSAAMLALLRGDYANGLTQFEWRWRLKGMPPRDFSAPVWQGEPLAGKTILLHAEQGYGDTIQCLRFMPDVAARGGRLVLELPGPLTRLGTSLEGGGEIVSRGRQLPHFDVHCAFMSLPRVLGTTLRDLPGQVPYLHADPGAVERWSRRFADAPGLKVGLVWAGNRDHANDRRRSIAIERLGPLLAVPGVRFFSLQVGERAGDLARLPQGKVADLAADLTDFGETAGALANLDLLVAVDTSVVHLAGALGRSTFVMLAFSPDWRWLTEREDSPWYPSLRLFRQAAIGEWESVIGRVGEALATLAAARRPAGPPVDADKLHDEAMALRRGARPADAAAVCERILASQSDYAPALRLLGVIREEAGDHKAAAGLLARLAELHPDDAEAHYNLGIALNGLERVAAAIEHYRRAAALAPDQPKPLNNLGNALRTQGDLAEAEAVFRRAIILDPAAASAHNNLGTVLEELGRLPEAAESYQRALALKTDFAEAYLNLGHARQRQGRYEDALASYRAALTIRLDYPDAHLAEAFLLLLTRQDFADGLAKLEWRWRLPGIRPRGFRQPLWLGEEIEGKTILLHAEQGFGDTVQFLRYVPQVAGRGARVILEVPAALRRLTRDSTGSDVTVITAGQPLPAFDLQCPLMSLPLAFGTTPDSIPAQIPYLKADPASSARWRQRVVSAGGGRKIGIAWAGNPRHANDRTRSIAIGHVVPLFGLAGTRWLSLQTGDRRADLAGIEGIVDLSPELTDFAESAAGIAGLDLVITVDTAVAHLAGALGKPTWILLPFDPDWRWFLGREDSPWYPTVRLFRQAAPGNWQGVVESLRTALLAWLAVAPVGSPSTQISPPTLDKRYFAAVELIEARRDAEGEAALRSLLVDDPGHAPTLRRLAWICHRRGDNVEAADMLARSLEREADNAESHYNLGLVLAALGRREAAEASYRRGLALKPASIDGLNNLGVLLEDVGRFDEAEACYRRAIDLAPQLAQPHNNLGVLLKESGQLAAALAAHRRAISLNPGLPAVHSNMLYTLNYDETVSRQALFKVHEAWGRIPGVSFATDGARFTNASDPTRRLRIGYVSGDFRHHSVAFFVEPLLEAHDRGEVEIFLYTNDARADPTTARIRAHADHWVPIHNLSDEIAAARIRQDAIDILVDLSGHTSGNRMLLFARKPAPIAVNWLGYPNTTGLQTIDYRITDAAADPPGEADDLHTERLVRLAPGFLCYRPPAQAGPIAALPASSSGHVTFGSFNNFAKLSPRTIALWARLLREVAGSRLLLKAPQFKDRGTRERCAAAFAAEGVAAERLEVVGPLPMVAEHLALYGRVDIALDPLCFNGTTTTCEALWMGVPVVTLPGDRHVARVGASILTAVGLQPFIAATVEHYIAIAREVARDLPRLADLRGGLRERTRTSPLCDASGFARAVEAAFRTMWQSWCTTQRADAAPVAGEIVKPAGPLALDAAEAAARRLLDAGSLDEAEALLRRVLDRAPNRAWTWFLLGRVRHAKGDGDAAIDLLRKAVALDPKLAPAYNDLGIFLLNQGRLEEAEACCRRAVELDGRLAECMTNLGAVLAARGRLEDASSWYARAIAADGQSAPAHNNLGAALVKLDRPEEAEALHRRAIALNPDFPDAHYNLGVALHDQGRFEQALACYDKAVRLKPEFVDARWNRAFSLLLSANYAEGWREHEWRWRRKEQPPRSFRQPLWRGEPIEGRSILLHAEQGIGDTLQFMRYVPLVAARGARVVLQVQRPALRLAAMTFQGIAQVIGDGDVPPPFDLHCPLLSLPLAFGTTLDTVPAEVPYLAVDPGAGARWRERLSSAAGLKVALVWAGSPQHKNDRNRSIAFERLAPLFAIGGIRWFSLQVGERAADLARHSAGAVTDLSAALSDFGETAAAVAAFDLVIAVDTAVAHLAGALRKPVWVMLPHVADWRWLIGRNDSPWYPSARLFRQPARGDWESVVLCVRRALEERAGVQGATSPAEVSRKLADAGVMLRAGDLDGAERALDALLAIDPTQGRTWHMRGIIAQRRNDHTAAAVVFRRALALDPDTADAHNNLGVTLGALGRRDEAIGCYRRALALQPDYAKAHLNLGAALMTVDAAEADKHLRQAIAIDPGFAEGHFNLGNLLETQKAYHEAAASFRRAVELKPEFYDAHNNLGAALLKGGDAAAALVSFERAVALRPEHAEAHHNLANAWCDLGRYADALDGYRRAIALDPSHVQANFSAALVLLLRGDLREGFERYEWRWRLKTLPPRAFSASPWSGEDLAGRTILLHAEQGYGDAILGLRYVPLVAARGGRVMLEVPQPLMRLAERLPAVAQVVARGATLPGFDLHCPLLSLPRAFGTALETIPAVTPYLDAHPEAVARWRSLLGPGSGLKVGLVWAGSPQFSGDELRSIPLDTFLPLLHLEGSRWFSLQVGERAADLQHLPDGLVTDLSAQLTDFAETAAAICNLDLVIAVDTAVAHLAGALGRPVWVLVRSRPDWRWLLARDDSPWYPTLRLFRQRAPGDWKDVVRILRDALAELAKEESLTRFI